MTLRFCKGSKKNTDGYICDTRKSARALQGTPAKCITGHGAQNATDRLHLRCTSYWDTSTKYDFHDEIDTEMSQSCRVQVKNKGPGSLEYLWKVVMVEHSQSANASSQSDGQTVSEEGYGTASVSALAGLSTTKGTQTISRYDSVGGSSFSQASIDIDNPPFIVEPCSGVIAAMETQAFNVKFIPLEVGKFEASLICSIANLKDGLQGQVVVVKGRSLLPYCHFELEDSNYISGNRRNPELSGPRGAPPGITLNPNTRVIEFQAVGVNTINRRSFYIMNPTNTDYSFQWVSESAPDVRMQPMFFCMTEKGYISAGKKTEVSFQFVPQQLNITESFWSFIIPDQNITIPFLLCGNTTEPSVSLEDSHINYKFVLEGHKAHKIVNMFNKESSPFSFHFKEDTLYSEGYVSKLTVEPMEGIILPHSRIPIVFSCISNTDGNVNWNVVCDVKSKTVPLTLNVKMQGYSMKATVTCEGSDGTVSELSHQTINEISFGEVELNDDIRYHFVISNNGKFNFGFDWELSGNPRILNCLKLTCQWNYVETGSNIPASIRFHPDHKLVLKDVELKLKIHKGPTFTCVLTGYVVTPSAHLSFTRHDFGSCFIYSAGMAPSKKTLIITNKQEQAIGLFTPVALVLPMLSATFTDFRFLGLHLLFTMEVFTILAPRETGGHPLPVAVKVTAALNLYAIGPFQASSGNFSGISQPSVHKCFHDVTGALFARTGNYIQFNVGQAQQKARNAGFAAITGIPILDCLFPNNSYMEVKFQPCALAPKKTTEAIIIFYPREPIKYQETVTFEINGLFQQSVKIFGQGVEMKIEVVNHKDKVVNLKAPRVGQIVKKVVPIVNRSSAPLTFTLTVNPNQQLLQDVKCTQLLIQVQNPGFQVLQLEALPANMLHYWGALPVAEYKFNCARLREDVSWSITAEEALLLFNQLTGIWIFPVHDGRTYMNKLSKILSDIALPAMSIGGRGGRETASVAPKMHMVLSIWPSSNIKLDANGGTCNVVVTFCPTYRIPQFAEEVMMECTGVSRPLFAIRGCGQGIEIILDQDCIAFGAVVLCSQVTRLIMIQNVGDIGARFKWDIEKFKPHFSISPVEGYISPGMHVSLEVAFHPAKVHADLRLENVQCFIEGFTPLQLYLTGSCVTATAMKEVINFSCQVRTTQVHGIVLVNRTNQVWNLQPLIDGEYWIGPKSIVIQPHQQNQTYEITYRPLSMTMDGKKHQGSVFFPLPDGTGMLYMLYGIAEPPKAVAIVNREVPCKIPHTVLLSINNWLPKLQRFRATIDQIKPERLESTTTLKGLDYIEVPGSSRRDYRLTFFTYKEAVISVKVTFRNEVTQEYLYYIVNIKSTSPSLHGTIELVAPVRQSTTGTVVVENPLTIPTVFITDCKLSDISLPAQLIVPPQAKGILNFEYQPLKVGEITGRLTLNSNELGVYHYDLILKGKVAGPEKPLHFRTTFGTSQTLSAKFMNHSRQKIEFLCKVDSHEFLVDKSIIASPASPGGSEIGVEVVYEPHRLGESRAILNITSSVGGDYNIPLYGVCLPAKPQGPFSIRAGASTSIPFKNIFPHPTSFSFQVDNPLFVCKPSETLRGKKTHIVVVSFEGTSNIPKYPVTGKLIVSCPQSTGNGTVTSWVYYLKGITPEK
ncbi:hydrocephalus-inducing protein-like [Mustelus asterias]